MHTFHLLSARIIDYNNIVLSFLFVFLRLDREIPRYMGLGTPWCPPGVVIYQIRH